MSGAFRYRIALGEVGESHPDLGASARKKVGRKNENSEKLREVGRHYNCDYEKKKMNFSKIEEIDQGSRGRFHYWLDTCPAMGRLVRVSA